MANELKPCPFCGSSKIQMLTTIFDCDIFCEECHASITRNNYSPCDSLSGTLKEAQPEAIEAWNRRVPQTTVNQYGENCSSITNTGILNISL